jgi:hypothetical protein
MDTKIKSNCKNWTVKLQNIEIKMSDKPRNKLKSNELAKAKFINNLNELSIETLFF